MKMKTHKALSKRLKVTKNGKMIKRTSGQDHFNSREDGKTRRNKRSDKTVSETHRKAVEIMMPYV
ncbi:MAG: 50S ribosomal protein L35 [Patescibacteria group bacterium]